MHNTKIMINGQYKDSNQQTETGFPEEIVFLLSA